MKERGDGSVSLDNQCPVAVGSFLDFAYSGETLITEGNVDVLFQLASFLQVDVQPVISCRRNIANQSLVRYDRSKCLPHTQGAPTQELSLIWTNLDLLEKSSAASHQNSHLSGLMSK